MQQTQQVTAQAKLQPDQQQFVSLFQDSFPLSHACRSLGTGKTVSTTIITQSTSCMKNVSKAFSDPNTPSGPSSVGGGKSFQEQDKGMCYDSAPQLSPSGRREFQGNGLVVEER